MKYIKSIKILCVGCLSALLCTSCDLDLTPIDYYGSGNFWNTEAQVESYMTGIHVDLRNNQWNMQYLMGEARGGTSKVGTSSLNTSINYDQIKVQRFDSNNTGFSSWAGFYGNIFDCNLLIQEVEKNEALRSDNINYMLGQAYGIRAYYYFHLYRTFGGVPLIDRVKVLDGAVTAEELYTARSTPKQTMDFIKADLAKSLEFFGSNSTIKGDKGYWSKAATQMLAGEVYLWSAKVPLADQTPAASDLSAAEGFFKALESDTRFKLLDSFAEVFNTATKKGNQETIFAIRRVEGESTGNAGEFVYADPNGNFINQVNGRDGNLIKKDTLLLKGNGWQRNEYKEGLWKAFNAQDSRRDHTFLDFYYKDGRLQGTILKKNLGFVNSAGLRIFCGDDPVYRYAEVLLYLAEIENMKGGDPAKYINLVRKRAYASNWDESVYGYKNSDFLTNELTILNERDKEFVNEGKRWFDVCRMKDAPNGKALVFNTTANYDASTSILDYATEAHKVLWPIDKATLNADPMLKQTPGYQEAGQEIAW